MLERLIAVFDFATDANELADKTELLATFEKTIMKLLNLIIECSIFIRNYIRRGFFSEYRRRIVSYLPLDQFSGRENARSVERREGNNQQFRINYG